MTIDVTIVTVALPTIKTELGFSDSLLVWLVNAYVVTYGCTLLLAGRMGDQFGYRKLLLLGIILFTLASLWSGLAVSRQSLVAARAIQGIGGALLSSMTVPLIVNLFDKDSDRAKAMGIEVLVTTAGSGVAALLGGALTSTLSWRWIFLINVPVGAGVYALALLTLKADHNARGRTQLDIAGAVTFVAALAFAIGAILALGHTSASHHSVPALFAGAVLSGAAFLCIESRAPAPLIPLRLLLDRNLAVSCLVGLLWTAALYDWYFNMALYLQFVALKDPLHVGLAFLPANFATAVVSVCLAPILVKRYGTKVPLVLGVVLSAVGLLMLARVPSGSDSPAMLCGMLMLGVSTGMASSPLVLIALEAVKQSNSGLASGVLNTALMIGGMLGLATLAELSSARANAMTRLGTSVQAALSSGYHLAFYGGALVAGFAAVIGALLLRLNKTSP